MCFLIMEKRERLSLSVEITADIFGIKDKGEVSGGQIFLNLHLSLLKELQMRDFILNPLIGYPSFHFTL